MEKIFFYIILIGIYLLFIGAAGMAYLTFKDSDIGSQLIIAALLAIAGGLLICLPFVPDP